VQITYGISFDEFRTLQPAPRQHAGRTAFVLVMGLVCLSLIVPGAGLVLQKVADGQPPPALSLIHI